MPYSPGAMLLNLILWLIEKGLLEGLDDARCRSVAGGFLYGELLVLMALTFLLTLDLLRAAIAS